MPTPTPEHPDLFEVEDLVPREEAAAPAQPGDAAPTALDEFCAGLSPETQARLLRILQASHIGPKDPSLGIAACIQVKIEEFEARLGAATLSMERAHDELMSAETGATKYAARLREITEETKAAVGVTETYLTVLGTIKGAGRELLAEQLKAMLPRMLWKTAAAVVAADFAIRLLLSHLS